MVLFCIKKNICSCLNYLLSPEELVPTSQIKTKLLSKMDTMNNEYYDNYEQLEEMEHPKSQILIELKNQNINSLVEMNLSQFLYVVNEISPIYIQSLNLTENFLMELYQKLLLKKPEQIDRNSIVLLTKRLLTIFIFYNLDLSNDFIIFIKNKIWLFDINLYMSLLLNPENSNDSDQLKQVIKLNYHQILPIFKIVNYHSSSYSVFDFIILGKLINKETKLQHVRFFNLESVVDLITQTNASIYLNENLLEILNQLKLNSKLDQNYLSTVISILTKRFYLIN